MLVYNVRFKNSKGQMDETQLDIVKNRSDEVRLELLNLILSLKDEMDIQEITDIDFVEDTEESERKYTAIIYDKGIIVDESTYDDLQEAIDFANFRYWDEVFDEETGETLWKRG